MCELLWLWGVVLLAAGGEGAEAPCGWLLFRRESRAAHQRVTSSDCLEEPADGFSPDLRQADQVHPELRAIRASGQGRVVGPVRLAASGGAEKVSGSGACGWCGRGSSPVRLRSASPRRRSQARLAAGPLRLPARAWLGTARGVRFAMP